MKQKAPLHGSGFARLAAARWPWVILLLLLALGYYGSYVRYNIGFRDEGQTVALGAQRLLLGEVPLREVVLNYNVLWFYPVVGLFKLCGVNYVLLRGYCLALSALTAVLTFLLVARTTRRSWLAFAVALIPLLIPGSPFKNYIPLLAVANTFCLLELALSPADARSSLWKALLAGTVLGLSFLIRIDIALLFAVLATGLLLLRALLGSTPVLTRLGLAAGSFILMLLAVAGVHWPVWQDAQRRHFATEFAEQYREKGRMLTQPLLHLLPHAAPPLPVNPVHAQARSQIPRRTALRNSEEPASTPGDEKQTLARANWRQWKKSGENSGPAFVFLTYAPLAGALAFIAAGVVLLISGLRQTDADVQQRGLAVLVLIGGALTTFPQFFFFRPDVPHLSEFMPGYIAAAAAAGGLLWSGQGRRWGALLGTGWLALHFAIYVYALQGDRWAGTWAVRLKRNKLFSAENGVRVYVSSRDFAGLAAIQKLLREHAPNPSDYIACYPYSPGINLLANRPTFEKNVYVDNAMHTRHWDAETIARFEQYQPAAIVLSDWEINGTKASRFSVWAVRTKTWIQTHYTFQGSYVAGSDAFEIYTRSPAVPGAAR